MSITLPASQLRQLQTEVETRVQGLVPDGVKVLSRSRGNIANDVTNALTKMGIAVVVFPPAIRKVNASIARSVVADVEITVRISETPLTNKTGADIYQLLEALIKGMHQTRLSDEVPLYVGEGSDDSPAEGAATIFSQTFTCKLTLNK